MARKSNTRTKVRELAEQLHAAGEPVTPTKIRQLLGTGSPNTIVSELKAWRSQQELKAAENISTPSATENNAETYFKEISAQLINITKTNEALARSVTELATQLENNKSWLSSELDKAYERYEAVQHHALLQVDAARDHARFLKEQLEHTKAEFEIRESSLKQRLHLALQRQASNE